MGGYVGRLAPSPTGALHLGNVRTFMIAWLRARSQGGRVVFAGTPETLLECPDSYTAKYLKLPPKNTPIS